MKSDHSNSKRDRSVWKWRDRRKASRGESKGNHTFTYLYPSTEAESGSESLDGKLLHFDSQGIAIEPSAPATEQLIQFRPHAVTSSSVTLVEMLEVFRNLEDPQSRVFGGVYFGDAWKTRGEKHAGPPLPEPQRTNANFPLFSGVASPGSRVDVTLSDEAGVPQNEVTVYTDAGGNWVAPFEGVNTSGTTWLAEISLLPAAWSGTVESRNYIISFPGGDILSHEDVRTPVDGELYGVVFATNAELPEKELSGEW